MIEMYTGTPGSGKSLHVAKVIYQKLCTKRNVITNFDINLSVFKRKKIGDFLFVDNSELNPNLLIKYAMEQHKRNSNGNISEGQTLIVIDECQILFNAREWNARDRMQWATFFTQHRKFGFNIILITQFDRLIDRQIRSLVEYEIVHRKVSNFKTIGLMLGLFVRGNLFVAVTRWYGVRERVGSEMFIAMPRYMKMYDSYKIFNGQSKASEDTSKVAEVIDSELRSDANEDFVERVAYYLDVPPVEL